MAIINTCAKLQLQELSFLPFSQNLFSVKKLKKRKSEKNLVHAQVRFEYSMLAWSKWLQYWNFWLSTAIKNRFIFMFSRVLDLFGTAKIMENISICPYGIAPYGQNCAFRWIAREFSERQKILFIREATHWRISVSFSISKIHHLLSW